MENLKTIFLSGKNKRGNILKFSLVFMIVVLTNKITLSTPINAYIDHVTPSQIAVNVNKSSNIDIVFTQSMNASTINNSNIKVYGLQKGLLSSSITYNAGTKTATINPSNDFKFGEKIQVTLTSGIRTSAGASLISFTYMFTVQSLSGTGDFTEVAHPFLGDRYLYNILTGDFDKDGYLDLCVYSVVYGTLGNAKIIILKNDETGNFNDTTNFISINYTGSIPSLTLLDCDNDGDLDIAASNYDFVIFKNNGNGIFNQSLISPQVGGSRLTAGDFDSDGDIDLAAAGDHSLKILLNDGTGNFTSGNTYDCGCGCGPGGISMIIADDINNDGNIDLIVRGMEVTPEPYCYCTYAMLFKNNGLGSFIQTNIQDLYFNDMASGDINSDSDVDLLASPSTIYNNNGQGVFSLTSYPGTGGVIELSDFDSDGDLDIAECRYFQNYLNVYKNAGTGIFNLYSSISTFFDPTRGTALGDFDANGSIDIAVPNGETGKLSIFLNNVTTYNIKIAIEGLYNISTNRLNINDTVKAYLVNTATPLLVVDSSVAVIDSVTLTGQFIFSHAPTGRYYIKLKHRNGLETWSKDGGEMFTRGSTLSYDFTSFASQAYGNNMIMKGMKWCIYSGDVNQDGIIEATDLSMIDNDAFNFVTGYVSTDLDGNSFIDASDAAIADNNASNFIAKIVPPGAGPQTPIDNHNTKRKQDQPDKEEPKRNDPIRKEDKVLNKGDNMRMK